MTTTANRTIQKVLDDGNPGELGDAARKIRLGTMLMPLTVTFAGLTAAASFDLTDPDLLANATVNDGDIPEGYVASNTPLPAANVVRTLRVTASGTAANVGTYIVGDAAATMVGTTSGAAVGIARISDDGKTITFPSTVTGFKISYLPRGYQELDAKFAPST